MSLNAYKRINRDKYLLLPPCIDDWVPKNHLARVIDFFVEEVIDISSLGIKEENQLKCCYKQRE